MYSFQDLAMVLGPMIPAKVLEKILGMVLAMVLAMAPGHARVRALEGLVCYVVTPKWFLYCTPTELCC